MDRNRVPSSFDFEARDWEDLVALGWLQMASRAGTPYLFGVPVQVYAQGFPQGVIWIRDQSGEVGVELAHECVTEDDAMPNLPVHEYDVRPHPQEFVEVARGHLTAGGFDVFTFTLDETVTMAKGKGYHGWLSLRGYDFKSCEPVWFKLVDRKSSVHLMIGAMKLPPR